MLYLIIYLILAALTLLYSGFNCGVEMSEVKDKLNESGAPPQYIQVNYTNVFFQGLAWPAYWAVFIGMKVYKKRKGI